VTIPLNISISGNYEIHAGLFDTTNNTLIVTSSNEINCSHDNITVTFNGSKIYKKEYNGTFEFKAKIFDINTWFECDRIINITNYYNYSDFVTGVPEAIIFGNYENFTNINGDLVINVTINVSQNETKFELYADLFDNTSTIYITNFRNITYFNNVTGDITSQLVFNGSVIENSSVEAPYKLAYLRLSVYDEAVEIWEILDVKIAPYYTNGGV
jgi:hypothetical protein